jgi:isoaspartyl peptidase/L-asparaginase-like protein (Ntn-hydrolase superfamily)
MALVRFTPNGRLDTSVIADLSGFGDFGHALAIDSQGRIVAAGSAGGQFGLMRAFL